MNPSSVILVRTEQYLGILPNAYQTDAAYLVSQWHLRVSLLLSVGGLRQRGVLTQRRGGQDPGPKPPRLVLLSVDDAAGPRWAPSRVVGRARFFQRLSWNEKGRANVRTNPKPLRPRNGHLTHLEATCFIWFPSSVSLIIIPTRRGKDPAKVAEGQASRRTNTFPEKDFFQLFHRSAGHRHFTGWWVLRPMKLPFPTPRLYHVGDSVLLSVMPIAGRFLVNFSTVQILRVALSRKWQTVLHRQGKPSHRTDKMRGRGKQERRRVSATLTYFVLSGRYLSREPEPTRLFALLEPSRQSWRVDPFFLR